MDALTGVSLYFPCRALTSFWVLANLVINNQQECQPNDRKVLIALLVIFGVVVSVISCTDTYTASSSQSYPVLIFPVYGPICYTLPTFEDKDRVYESYYLKIRDYVHAVISTTVFVLIAIFISPVSNCLFPSDANDEEGAKFNSSTVRTIPIVVAIVGGLIMMCLGPPRQMLGCTNVPETCPSLEKQLTNNPIYAKNMPSNSGVSASIPEEDESDYESGLPPPPTLQCAPSTIKRQTSQREAVYQAQESARTPTYHGTPTGTISRSRSMSPPLKQGRESYRESQSVKARGPSPGGQSRSEAQYWHRQESGHEEEGQG